MSQESKGKLGPRGVEKVETFVEMVAGSMVSVFGLSVRTEEGKAVGGVG